MGGAQLHHKYSDLYNVQTNSITNSQFFYLKIQLLVMVGATAITLTIYDKIKTIFITKDIPYSKIYDKKREQISHLFGKGNVEISIDESRYIALPLRDPNQIAVPISHINRS